MTEKNQVTNTTNKILNDSINNLSNPGVPGNPCNISYHRIEKDIHEDNYLNDQLQKLYLEQEKRKLEQQKRKKWIKKWGTCCFCFLS